MMVNAWKEKVGYVWLVEILSLYMYYNSTSLNVHEDLYHPKTDLSIHVMIHYIYPSIIVQSSQCLSSATKHYPSPPIPFPSLSPSLLGFQLFTVLPLSTSTTTLLPSIFFPSPCLYAATQRTSTTHKDKNQLNGTALHKPYASGLTWLTYKFPLHCRWNLPTHTNTSYMYMYMHVK